MRVKRLLRALSTDGGRELFPLDFYPTKVWAILCVPAPSENATGWLWEGAGAGLIDLD